MLKDKKLELDNLKLLQDNLEDKTLYGRVLHWTHLFNKQVLILN